VARASLAIREKVERNSFGVTSSRGLIGSALVGQKRYAEAEPLLVAACEEMRRLGHT